ncbi:MAG: ATP-dependent helicase [Caldiserica bacterium]|nr:ATP-dependent helicase [Caldisericota bacterium]
METTVMTREVLLSPEAIESLGSLPAELHHQSSEKLTLLATNPFHPSLNAHRLTGLKNVHDKWECYINLSHRIIYDLGEGELRIWDIGDHSIVDRARNMSFAAGTMFQRLQAVAEPAADDKLFVESSDSSENVIAKEQPFLHLTSAHLRVLGVPRGLVKQVQNCDGFDVLEAMPGLLEHTVAWLEELATDQSATRELFSPDDLFFRTTVSRLQGYCEGKIRQLMLNLEPEQQLYVDKDFSSGAVLLRGCAGSGKTTVALYRAIRLAEKGESVLFLTFSKALSEVATTLLKERIGDPLPRELEVRTIAQWAARLIVRRGRPHWDTPVEEQQTDLMQQAAKSAGVTNPHPILQDIGFLLAEVHCVIKAIGLATVEQYLSVRRIGRGTGLQAPARKAVWAAHEQYQKLLEQSNMVEWEDLPLLAHRALDQASLDSPYAHVIVDEAQDLTAVEIRLAQRMGTSLFLAGDIAQSIYTRGYSWKYAGLALQGHSFSLRRNFRNSRQVAQAAAAFIGHDVVLKASEDWVDPEQATRTGPWPVVLAAASEDGEVSAVCDRILDLAGGNEFRIGDFAILCRTNEQCDRVMQYLAVHNVPTLLRERNSPFNILEEKVKVMTIHSAKGLEFPVVFVMGWHEGQLPILHATADAETAGIELEAERMLAYVAMTRASEALYLITSPKNPSRFLDEIPTEMKLVEDMTKARRAQFG